MLTVRERRFVNNFVGTLDREQSRYWAQNLNADLASYRYPHQAEIRATVNKLAKAFFLTGVFTPISED